MIIIIYSSVNYYNKGVYIFIILHLCSKAQNWIWCVWVEDQSVGPTSADGPTGASSHFNGAESFLHWLRWLISLVWTLLQSPELSFCLAALWLNLHHAATYSCSTIQVFIWLKETDFVGIMKLGCGVMGGIDHHRHRSVLNGFLCQAYVDHTNRSSPADSSQLHVFRAGIWRGIVLWNLTY